MILDKHNSADWIYGQYDSFVGALQTTNWCLVFALMCVFVDIYTIIHYTYRFKKNKQWPQNLTKQDTHYIETKSNSPLFKKLWDSQNPVPSGTPARAPASSIQKYLIVGFCLKEILHKVQQCFYWIFTRFESCW
jgi:hypothetical protein